MSIELSYQIRDYHIELLFLQQEFVACPSYELLSKMAEIRRIIFSLRQEAAAIEARAIVERLLSDQAD